MIPIPHSRSFTVTMQGSVLKLVQCEQCGCEYIYQMVRSVQGSGTSFMFLDNQGAKDRAARQAETKLQRALETGCDPVPCPDCGWYQAPMVPVVRRAYHRWMWVAGVVGWIIAIVAGLITWVCSINTRNPPDKETLALLSMITVGAAVGGTALVVGRKILSLQFDPNTSDEDARKLLGESRAVRRKEIEERSEASD